MVGKEIANADIINTTEQAEHRFSKSQLLVSAKYAGRRDAVAALLDNEKQYTTKEVDQLVNQFMKGMVN